MGDTILAAGPHTAQTVIKLQQHHCKALRAAPSSRGHGDGAGLTVVSRGRVEICPGHSQRPPFPGCALLDGSKPLPILSSWVPGFPSTSSSLCVSISLFNPHAGCCMEKGGKEQPMPVGYFDY